MQLSQIPTMVPLPFAENGTKNTIPESSQIGVTPGAASLNDGFPPLTFTPLAAGGIPPAGADFNGILNLLSANTQWQNAGGFSQYNSAFSTAVGGYPKTALLAKASGSGYWLSLADNNATDPDTGGAGWIAFDPWAIQAAQYTTAPDVGTVNAYAVVLAPVPAALTPGMLVSIKTISNTNTGAATLTVNGLGTLPILLAKNTPLIGGELVAGYGAICRLNNAGTAWELIWTGAGSFGIAATASNQAVNLGQAQADFAAINGNSSEVFNVSNATASNQAVNLSQVANAAPVHAVAASTTATSVTATTGTFTAPCDGWLMAYGYGQSSTTGTNGSGLSSSLGGLVAAGVGAAAYSVYQTGYVPMTTGQQTTLSFNTTAGSAAALDAFISAFFIPNP